MLINEITNKRITTYLTEQQEREVRSLCEDVTRFLKESQLTPKQVYQLFEADNANSVKQQAQQLIQADKSIDGFKNKLKSVLQSDGGRVDSFDQKFADIQSQIAEKAPASVMKAIKSLQAWAHEDPRREWPVMFVLGVIAAFIASTAGLGVIATAAVIGLVAFAMKLLLGSKFSQAVKAGVISGTIGAALGGAVHGLESIPAGEIIHHAPAPIVKGVEQLLHGGIEASIEGELAQFAQGMTAAAVAAATTAATAGTAAADIGRVTDVAGTVGGGINKAARAIGL